MRPSTNAESPPGRPDILYFNLKTTKTLDYVVQVEQEDIDVAP